LIMKGCHSISCLVTVSKLLVKLEKTLDEYVERITDKAAQVQNPHNKIT
jgi:hypothetical protein